VGFLLHLPLVEAGTVFAAICVFVCERETQKSYW